jgi:hypothetical protein
MSTLQVPPKIPVNDQPAKLIRKPYSHKSKVIARFTAKNGHIKDLNTSSYDKEKIEYVPLSNLSK